MEVRSLRISIPRRCDSEDLGVERGVGRHVGISIPRRCDSEQKRRARRFPAHSFQYLEGAIQSQKLPTNDLCLTRFQYLEGAIQRGMDAFLAALQSDNFNTSKVRFRAAGLLLYARSAQNFNTSKVRFRGALERRGVGLIHISIPRRCDSEGIATERQKEKRHISIPRRCDSEALAIRDPNPTYGWQRPFATDRALRSCRPPTVAHKPLGTDDFC